MEKSQPKDANETYSNSDDDWDFGGRFLPEMRGRRAISRRTHTVQPVKSGRSSHAQRGGGKDGGIHRNGKGHILDHAFRE